MEGRHNAAVAERREAALTGSHRVTARVPWRITFLAVSAPTPPRPTTKIFIFTSLRTAARPMVAICREYLFWKTFSSASSSSMVAKRVGVDGLAVGR